MRWFKGFGSGILLSGYVVIMAIVATYVWMMRTINESVKPRYNYSTHYQNRKG